MELTFNTKTYNTLVKKNATIYSNDLAKSQMKIFVNAKIYEVQDSTLTFSWAPERLDFTQAEREFEVVVTNKGTGNLTLSSDDPGWAGLDINIKDASIKPGKSGKVKFKWSGEFDKENLERSVTFSAHGGRETRFTVPFMVQGTDPTPPKVAKTIISPSTKEVKSAEGSKKAFPEAEKSGD